ncbi:hypothetical protein GCM10023116_15850 [Kistimonas scapharcae]|uniref:Uncharacterized protein n=2 Tax=Kistimonas scapharcae TaxID=1036133 RepID=A0ABP8V252_9GAMM
MTPDQASEKLIKLMQTAITEEYPDVNISFTAKYGKILADESQLLSNNPIDAKAPEFLGSYDAYGWGLSSTAIYTTTKGKLQLFLGPCYEGNKEVGDMDMITEKVRQCYMRVTKHLPSWIYYYHVGANKTPAILNQGKIFNFIEPAADKYAAHSSY